jgi:Tol biopolymer transport system component
MKPIARQIFSMIIVGLVASVRFQNVAVGAETATDHQQRFAIAVPDFPDSFTSDGTSGRDVARAIISDLQADGRFTLVHSSIALEAKAVLPQFDRWRSTNAEWLVAGSIRQSPPNPTENGKSRALVDIRLWNVVKGTAGLWERYIVNSADLQRVPHLVAAEIVKQLTSAPDPSDAASDHPN